MSLSAGGASGATGRDIGHGRAVGARGMCRLSMRVEGPGRLVAVLTATAAECEAPPPKLVERMPSVGGQPTPEPRPSTGPTD